MAIRKDYWTWAIKIFGKDKLINLIDTHPRKDLDLFLNKEERDFVESLLK